MCYLLTCNNCKRWEIKSDNNIMASITGCEDGYYGSNCSQQCGHCKDGISCASNGHCPSDCESGWFGRLCVDGK